jgi:hypothetical protein
MRVVCNVSIAASNNVAIDVLAEYWQSQTKKK